MITRMSCDSLRPLMAFTASPTESWSKFLIGNSSAETSPSSSRADLAALAASLSPSRRAICSARRSEALRPAVGGSRAAAGGGGGGGGGAGGAGAGRRSGGAAGGGARWAGRGEDDRGGAGRGARRRGGARGGKRK